MAFKRFKEILSLTLAVMLLIYASLALFSCSAPNKDGDDTPDDDDNGVTNQSSYHDKIIVPEPREYPGRQAQKFSEIEYKRPSFEAIISDFNEVIKDIEDNDESFDIQMNKILSLEESYFNTLTMYQIANIYNSRDSANEYWAEEFSYISTNYPSFTKVVEELYVAAANSPHAEDFEDEYFGEELIEKYKDGGSYTDELVELLAAEAEYEADFKYLSPATVKITYAGITDYAQNLINNFKIKYGEGATEYQSAYAACMVQYNNEYEKLASEIYVSLIRIRRLIADELGYDSYADYAYEALGHEYTKAEMSAFLDDIEEFVVPVYSSLYNEVLTYYFATTVSSQITLDKLINNAYYIFKNTDDELFNIYCYMLQYSLFDIEKGSSTRFEGAYTTYLDEFDSPFIFMTASGRTHDFATLFHEFGHFADEFTNFGASASLDLSEVSSQGLELIMLHRLSSYISPADTSYLKYRKLSDAMETLLIQGFYARFEEQAYKLEYEDISLDTLEDIIGDIASDFGLNSNYVNRLSSVILTHTVCYPFYVQSYCTSIVPSVELYFMEQAETGAGIDAYMTLLDRTESGIGFEENLARAGLRSPFEKEYLKELANNIYKAVMNRDYYDDSLSGAA